MTREVLLLVDALAREKNVEKDIVFIALELALASATKKRFHEDADVLKAITQSDMHTYMAAQNEAQAVLEWLKKFAMALLKKIRGE